MTHTTKKWLGAAAIVFTASVLPGCLREGDNVVKAAPTMSRVANGLVDLTQAAEISVNAVVYIKVTTNGRTQTVDVQDPFSDFFGDFFGFGGGGTQRRQIQTPKRRR